MKTIIIAGPSGTLQNIANIVSQHDSDCKAYIFSDPLSVTVAEVSERGVGDDAIYFYDGEADKPSYLEDNPQFLNSDLVIVDYRYNSSMKVVINWLSNLDIYLDNNHNYQAHIKNIDFNLIFSHL
jgi:hypothetical protein